MRLFGKTFVPEALSREHELPYDGRLDGQRWVFALYDHPWCDGRKRAEMWGTPRAKACVGHPSDDAPGGEDFCDWPGPNCIDGWFQWSIWVEEEAA